MSKRKINLYLADIKDAIGKIESYTKKMAFSDFSRDGKTIDAVVRNLEVIGEAVKNIPKTARDKNPHLPWGKIIGMRNKISHEYFGVDLDIIWQTIKTDLPELKQAIKKIKV